jgi:predicted Zn-dependent peptidase
VSPKGRAATTLGRTEYDSGLRVLTEQMPGVRSVTLGFWVDIGSRDERPSVAGASHYLEHLLFKGTKTRSAQDIAEAFDAVGGDLNAFSAKEYTCYHCRVLDRDLPMAVAYMTDMLQSSTIARADVDGERGVILEEIGMRDDAPDDLIHDLFAETLWKGHPLGRPVLGTRETINAITRQQVHGFYRRNYRPAKFVVAAAGNVRHDELCALLEKGMDAGKRLADPDSARKVRLGGTAPASPGGTLVTNRKTEQAHLCLGTSGLARNHPDRFAFGVVNVALGGGMSSRLFQEIREKRGLAYSVYSYHSQFAETGLFCVYAGTMPGRAKEVLGIVRRELRRMAEDGLSAEELDRAKGHVKGSLVLSLEETPSRMSRLGKSEIGHGEILSIDEILDRIDSVTREDAQRVAGDIFGRPQTLTVVGPFKAKDFEGAAA